MHHYWLDDGATVFDLMPQARRDQRLLTYDMRSFLAIRPTFAAAKALKGFGCVYKDTALGCVVAAPNDALLPIDTMFGFLVTVRSSAFYDYTALTLRPQKVYDLYHQVENKTYRYKENVPVLSNLTGASRGTGVNKALFLSKEIPALAADDGHQFLSLSGSDAVMFEIDGTQLYLKAGTVLDYEQNPALDVTVAVDDPAVGTSPDGTTALTIGITNVNEPPAVALVNAVTTLPENTDTTARIRDRRYRRDGRCPRDKRPEPDRGRRRTLRDRRGNPVSQGRDDSGRRNQPRARRDRPSG